jgi:hypothetical protein
MADRFSSLAQASAHRLGRITKAEVAIAIDQTESLNRSLSDWFI